MTYYFEYHFLYITGIDRVESKSIQGAALMKLVFHEGTNMSQAMAETVGYVDRARAFMPPGAVPPFIIQYNNRYLPNSSPLEELRQLLNTTKVPEFEASATTGQGVFETLKAISKAVLTELRKGA